MPYHVAYRTSGGATGPLNAHGGRGGDSASSGGYSSADNGAGYAGLGAQIGGALTSAIGAYYSVKAAQYQAEAAASALDFQRQMAHIEARAAERDAQRALKAGQEAKARAGLQYGQVKAAVLTRQTAGGIVGGVGSAGEVAASIELAKETDQLTITRNSVREANAHRTRRVNATNRAHLAGTSADNLRSTAGSMNAGLSGLTSLLGNSGQVASSWYNYNRTT